MTESKIDPELLPAVSQLKAVLGDTACFNLDDLETARQTVSMMAQASQAAAPARPNVLIENKGIHDDELNLDVDLQTYKTKSDAKTQAAILYIHGGGYVLGAADQAQPKLSSWCEDLDVFIVSVDYRLAPENPFPAGLYDCFAALKWLASNAASLNIDPNRIAIVGESAGGGLAAGLALYARDHSDIDVSLLCLLYPMIDHTTVESVDSSEPDTVLWNRANNTFGWQSYLGNGVDDDMLPYAVPSMATDVSNLPTTYISVGDQDLFYAENQCFVKCLQSAGVDATLEVYQGGFHGFAEVNPAAQISQRFNNNIFNALRTALQA